MARNLKFDFLKSGILFWCDPGKQNKTSNVAHNKKLPTTFLQFSRRHKQNEVVEKTMTEFLKVLLTYAHEYYIAFELKTY